jgi:DNA-binding transcriptional ArsR family regulator
MPLEGRREVSDPRELRALAHPLRIRILRALSISGELTATEASEQVGESPAACSFHLRQLAKYGYVEEGERGPGRRRPWRRVATSVRYELEQEDAESGMAAAALAGVLRKGYVDRIRRAAEQYHAQPAEWRRATGHSDFTVWATPQEVREIDEKIMALLRQYNDRVDDPAKRPEGAKPVEFLLFAHPAEI